MTPVEIANALTVIKDRLRTMSGVSRTNPHAFAEGKSEVLRDLDVLQDAVRKSLPLPDRLKG